MSAQPFSRADRNRVTRGESPRCFAGRPARFIHREEMISVVTAVDQRAGTVTMESMTRAEYDRRFNPPLTVTPEDMRATFANPADAYHFRRGPSYERLADGSWLVTEGE